MSISNEINKRRQIIYVDITGEENNSIFKLGLYDPDNNRTLIMNLKEISSNNEAEKYGIYYAMLYIKKHNFENTIILCDNESAVNDKTIQSLSKFLKIKISWIPREINTVADKICKQEPTLKDTDWNLLELFIKLYKHHDSATNETLKEEIESLKKQLEEKNTKIKNQTSQLSSQKTKLEASKVAASN